MNRRLATVAAACALAASIPGSVLASPDGPGDAERRSYAAHVAAADGAMRLGEPADARRWLDGAPGALRGFEWAHLAARADQSAASADLGAGELMSVAASADGKLLAATSARGRTVIVDASTLAAVRVLEGHKGQVFRAEFDAEVSRLLTAGQDGTVRVWDTASGAERLVFAKHGRPVGAARFLADGRVASCAWEMTSEGRVAGLLHVWDAATGEVRWSSRGGAKPLVQLRVLPGGKQVAAASWDFCVFVWDVDSAEPPRKLEIPDEGVYRRANDVAASPDGRWIAVTSADRTARVFDAATGALAATLRDHGAEVWGVAFSPDGSTLATGGADGAVRLHATDGWRHVAVLRGHARAVASLVWLPDGVLVSAAADGTVRRWSAPADRYGDERFRHGGPCYASQVSADGRRLVTFGEDGDVRLWDALTLAPAGSFHAHDRTGVHAAFSRDGRLLVTTSWDRTAKLWDAATFAPLATLDCGAGVAHADFSPDGAFVACATTRGKSLVFATADGARVAELDVGERGAAQVRFRADGSSLAAGCGDGTVRVFATDGWAQRARIALHTAGIRSLDWVVAGPRLVTTAGDGTIRLADADAAAEVRLLAATDASPSHLRVSPDGRRVAVCAGGVLLIDSEHGGVLLRARVLADQPYDLDWAPDGSRLFVTDCPGTGVVLDTRPLRAALAEEAAAATAQRGTDAGDPK